MSRNIKLTNQLNVAGLETPVALLQDDVLKPVDKIIWLLLAMLARRGSADASLLHHRGHCDHLIHTAGFLLHCELLNGPNFLLAVQGHV